MDNLTCTKHKNDTKKNLFVKKMYLKKCMHACPKSIVIYIYELLRIVIFSL